MKAVFTSDKKPNLSFSHTYACAHVHTSAWNVVGASTAKRTENVVRVRRKEGGGCIKGNEISGKNMNGGREVDSERDDGPGDSKPGDDSLKSEDLE